MMIKGLLRTLLEPFARIARKFFDPRFFHLDVQLQELRATLGTSTLWTSLRQLSDAVVGVNESLAVAGRSLKRVDQQLLDEQERSASLAAEVQAMRRALDQVALHGANWEAWRDDMTGDDLQGRMLSEQQAAFLNRAVGHTGPGRQAGLWLNPPVALRYDTDGAHVGVVNERIIELPFVLRALCNLPEGARILDVGACESTLSLSLAALGYPTTALDLHTYPFRHPNLTSVALPLEEWEGPDEPFDAVICLSSIEHFGLGAYGEDSSTDGAADVRALARLLTSTKPGGLLVLSVPFGKSGRDDLQRTYDLDDLRHLVVGWDLTSLSLAQQTSHDRWELMGSEEAADQVIGEGTRAVAMVTATRPPA